MKLLLSSLLILCSATLFAQKWEVGLNTGLLIDAHGNKFIPRDNAIKNVLSFTGSMHVARNIKQWQFGAAVDMLSLDAGTAGQYVYVLQYQDPYNPVFIQYQGDPNRRLKHAAPAMPFQLVANRKLTKTFIVPYVGAYIGYVVCYRPASDVPGGYNSLTYSGTAFGVQVGANCKIIKRLGINAEVKANDMRLKDDFGTLKRYSLSATAGLRYFF